MNEFYIETCTSSIYSHWIWAKFYWEKIPDVKHFTPQVVIERFNILLQVIVGMYTIDFSI